MRRWSGNCWGWKGCQQWNNILNKSPTVRSHRLHVSIIRLIQLYCKLSAFVSLQDRELCGWRDVSYYSFYPWCLANATYSISAEWRLGSVPLGAWTLLRPCCPLYSGVFPWGGCGVNVLESDEKEARANHWLQRMTYLYFQLTSKVLWGANLGRLREVMGSCSQFFFPKQGYLCFGGFIWTDMAMGANGVWGLAKSSLLGDIMGLK